MTEPATEAGKVLLASLTASHNPPSGRAEYRAIMAAWLADVEREAALSVFTKIAFYDDMVAPTDPAIWRDLPATGRKP